MGKMGGNPPPEPAKRRKKPAIEPGYGECAPTPAQVRKKLAVERRAIRERWPGYEKLLPLAVKTAAKLLRSKHDRSNRAGLLAAVAISGQVQKDDHLDAKIENSGVALIKYRETVTNSDGSTTTREAESVKLWAHDAPVEGV